MRKLNVLSVLALGLILQSCAHKIKIMDVSAVSMTKKNIAKNQKLVEKDSVEGRFCSSAFNDKGTVGLIDEAIKDAQKKSGADFIVDARFFREGGCVGVEGTAAKIAKRKRR